MSTYTLDKLASAYATLLDQVDDPSRPGLNKTPERAAKAMMHFTQGYQHTPEEVVGDALFPCENPGAVLVNHIEFYSLCEHHLLPFFGHCHIAYLPSNKVLGLSKLARLVDLYAQRLQLQEGLTQQIATAVAQLTGAKGVAVITDARHCCMMMRGVQKQDSSTRCISLLGEYETDPQAKQQLLAQLPMAGS